MVGTLASTSSSRAALKRGPLGILCNGLHAYIFEQKVFPRGLQLWLLLTLHCPSTNQNALTCQNEFVFGLNAPKVIPRRLQLWLALHLYNGQSPNKNVLTLERILSCEDQFAFGLNATIAICFCFHFIAGHLRLDLTRYVQKSNAAWYGGAKGVLLLF